MEDQGKRLLLAVAIAFGIMLVWQVVFPSKKPKDGDKQQEGAAEVEGKDGTSKNGANEDGADKDGADKDGADKDGADKDGADKDGHDTRPDSPDSTAEKPEAVPDCEGKTITVEGDLFDVTFTSCGGAIQSYQLLGDQYLNRETKTPMDLVRTSHSEGLPLTTGFADNSTTDIPPGAQWKGERVKDNEVKYTWESDALRVEKTYRVYPEDYIVEVFVDFTNLSQTEDAKQALSMSLYGFEDPSKATKRSMTKMPRAWSAGCFDTEEDELELYPAKKVIKKARVRSSVRWAGFVHTYFLAALAVDVSKDGVAECKITGLERQGAMRIDLVYPSVTLKPGDPPATRHMVGYFGPKYLSKLEAVGQITDFDHPSFEEAINFGWFGVISRPLLWLLALFQSFVVNWGVAIILLTIVVKLATLYWTHKSMKSMKEMAKLKPKLEAIKEKYADDKEAINRETMNLFKTHGVNPLSGCLPMLLQMPIWFALYRMLMNVAQLYQMPFIPGWINDLTQPDPFHILPIALTAMMFVQSRLTPVTQSGLQQKLIQYGMPIMFGVFSFFFPAGLTLYIFTNVCLTATHHLVLHREGRAEAKAAKMAKAKKMAAKADAEAAHAESSDDDYDDDEDGDDSDESSNEPESEGGKGQSAKRAKASSSDDGTAPKKKSKGSRSRGKRKRKRKR